MQVADQTNVAALLERLGLPDKGIAVAAVPRRFRGTRSALGQPNASTSRARCSMLLAAAGPTRPAVDGTDDNVAHQSDVSENNVAAPNGHTFVVSAVHTVWG